jgi:two-component system chemotaxis response regulator CheB
MADATNVRRDRVDTVVIGGSAGSLTALKEVLPSLPADLPAAILICQHVPVLSETSPGDLLRRHARMEVVPAGDEMELRPGRIVVARPDMHMMIGSDHVHLRRGAHENNFRPAIDPLFRSAAVYRATRAVGVIFSGLLDDGAAGARAIARTGGQVIVQDPDTAENPDMPRAALDAVPEARIVPLAEMAGAIADLVGRDAAPAPPIPWEIGLEMKIAALEGATMENQRRLGTLSPFNCPHCDGVLWEVEDGPMLRYRCHTGHAYTSRTLDKAQEEALDHQLFTTLRAHRGRAELLRRMSARIGGAGRELMERRATLVEEDAERLEAIVKQRGRLPRAEDG